MEKKYFILISLILCVFLGLSAASASEINTEDSSSALDDSSIQEITSIQSPEISEENIVDEDVQSLKISEENNDDVIVPNLKSSNGVPTKIVTPHRIEGIGNKAVVKVKVQFKFNDVISTVNVGTLKLFINNKLYKSADLSKNSNPTFKVPLKEGNVYLFKYSGGIFDPEELALKLNPSSDKAFFDERYIGYVTPNIDHNLKIKGNKAILKTSVWHYFNCVCPVYGGYLTLLKDGKKLIVKDLSKEKNPTFIFNFKKGSKYSLMYSGYYDIGDTDLSFVFKPTKVDVYTPNIHSNESGNQIQSKNNISSTGIPMQATGFPLAAILVALISIPLAYRRK